MVVPHQNKPAKLAHAVGPTETPLLVETIGENLERTAARFPDREALIVRHQGIRFTYTEFTRQIDSVAKGLLGLGIEVGDRVGIWSPNCAEWVLIQFATAKVGAILVNINPAYRSAELAHALRQSGCRLLVAAEEFRGTRYRHIVDELRPQQPALETVIYLDTEDWAQLLESGIRVTDRMLNMRSSALDAHQPINIQYTSGTTGLPKGATLTHFNILNNGYFTGERCGYTETDRVCIPVPFYHCFGMVLGNLACTTHGAAIVVPGPGFDPVEVLEAVEQERCTSLYGVPTMFIAELAVDDLAGYDLTSLRTGIMAGSPCPVEIMKRVISDMNMTEVTICYGMTETSPVSTQSLPDDDIDHRVSTVGPVHPHVEVKIIEPDTGATVEIGDTGELCTRGYSVMDGYWNDPVRTAQAIDVDGWMHSGDLATMDADGYVNIVGRIKDMIIRGGENIYPREIEEFLLAHPLVADVQIVGVPDLKYGEQVMAFILLERGADLSVEDVREHCRGRIAHYKIPKYVTFVDEYPMTITGKVQKYRLRELGIEELGPTATDPVETA